MSHKIFSTFQEAESFLFNSLPFFQRQGPAAYKADIGNISALLKYAGNPHLAPIKFIHIAGTNGKGSLTHLVASYILSCGFKTGIYTSPHYKNMRERIKIGNSLIPEYKIIEYLNFFIPVLDDIKPSFFELLCAMAFMYFKDEKVDYAVIETGMGGRLDSTNILQPILNVITNISFDHQAFLGNTLEKIAFEKAGIIKPNTPVVIGQKIIETQNIFIQKAEQSNSKLTFAEDNWSCHLSDFDGIISTYRIANHTNNTSFNYSSSLHGNYQEQNIQTFMEVCLQLDHYHHIQWKDSAIKMALAQVDKLTYFIGRWHVVQHKPTIILESAHNIDGIQYVVRQLKSMSYDNLYIIFGTVADKDVGPVLTLLPNTAQYIWTKANIPRAMSEEILYGMAQKVGLGGVYLPDVATSLQYAMKKTTKNDLILVTGSIFIVGDALKILE